MPNEVIKFGPLWLKLVTSTGRDGKPRTNYEGYFLFPNGYAISLKRPVSRISATANIQFLVPDIPSRKPQFFSSRHQATNAMNFDFYGQTVTPHTIDDILTSLFKAPNHPSNVPDLISRGHGIPFVMLSAQPTQPYGDWCSAEDVGGAGCIILHPSKPSAEPTHQTRLHLPQKGRSDPFLALQAQLVAVKDTQHPASETCKFGPLTLHMEAVNRGKGKTAVSYAGLFVFENGYAVFFRKSPNTSGSKFIFLTPDEHRILHTSPNIKTRILGADHLGRCVEESKVGEVLLRLAALPRHKYFSDTLTAPDTGHAPQRIRHNQGLWEVIDKEIRRPASARPAKNRAAAATWFPKP